MQATGGALTRFRQPEYTGENRCVPCTIVNVVIAALAGAAVGFGASTTASPTVAGGLGVGLFGLCLLVIYLRGYLVPGTPTLTKRYFPPWLLALFDKEAAPAPPRNDDGGLDAEAVLIGAGALEECADAEDLCLTDEFRQDWYGEFDRLDAENAGRERLLDILDIDEGEVEIDEYDDAFRARVDDQLVGTWQSEAAMLADLGAANALATRHDGWDALSVAERGQLLNGLRLFIDRCPSCGGQPEFGTETVESCCSTQEVAAVACPDCDARLFESRAV